MPAIDLSVLCIPSECDNIKLSYNGEIASRWDAYLLCDICRHFASAMLHFASLISHNLRCIPAYAHLIPTGLFQSLLNCHRDNSYIISKNKNIKNSLGATWNASHLAGQLCALRHCRQPHNPSATLSRGHSTLPQG